MRDFSGQTEVSAPGRPLAVSAVVQHDNWCYAMDAALDTILEGQISSPDLVILFVSSHYAEDYSSLVREVYRRTGAGCLIGTSSRGAIAGRESYECEPGLSIIAFWLPGATLTPVRLHQDMLDTIDAGDASQFPAPDEVNGWILFADPYRMDAQDALLRMRTRYAGVPFIGALSSTTAQDR
ncbi:MAG TPA: FIST N-terminal domain-containing protein, partial [Thermomicrobiales bacterium]|nr:FIST N-terminal domain-containing protein [Thermomicrobiales bacterium]